MISRSHQTCSAITCVTGYSPELVPHIQSIYSVCERYHITKWSHKLQMVIDWITARIFPETLPHLYSTDLNEQVQIKIKNCSPYNILAPYL